MDGRDGEELEEDDDEVSYIERFKRLWRNERCAPALLPHQEELIEKLKSDVEAQKENIALNRKMFQDSMSKVMLDAMELECDRFKFLLSSYLRCRIQKIQRFYMHLLADEEASERMTKAEQKFCEGYANVMERCMNSSENVPDVVIEDDVHQMNKGDIKVVSFRWIEQLMLDQQVELI